MINKNLLKWNRESCSSIFCQNKPYVWKFNVSCEIISEIIDVWEFNFISTIIPFINVMIIVWNYCIG